MRSFFCGRYSPAGARSDTMAQLVLPLENSPSLGRADFLVAPGNAQAVAFIDRWPDWPAPAVLLHGPAASGKSHLAAIWAAQAKAMIVEAAALEALPPSGALVVENIDALTPRREAGLFALLERGAPLLLTSHVPATAWQPVLPDLTSRAGALLSFGLWAPDEALLTALAVKLFADRQLQVPEAVVHRMLAALDRTPGAVRGFIAALDQRAYSEKRPVNLGLIKDLLAESTDLPLP